MDGVVTAEVKRIKRKQRDEAIRSLASFSNSMTVFVLVSWDWETSSARSSDEGPEEDE